MTVKSLREVSIRGIATLLPSLILSSPRKEHYDCLVRGRTAHSALEAEYGRNAICGTAKLINELPQGKVDLETTANIGAIHGGGQANIVPDEVRFTGEVRSFSAARFAETKERINAACAGMNRREGYGTEINWEAVYEGYAISRDEEVVRRFLRGYAKQNRKASRSNLPGAGMPTT